MNISLFSGKCCVPRDIRTLLSQVEMKLGSTRARQLFQDHWTPIYLPFICVEEAAEISTLLMTGKATTYLYPLSL